MNTSLTDQTLQYIFDRCFGLDETFNRCKQLIDEVQSSGQESPCRKPGDPTFSPAACPGNKGEKK